MKADFYIKLSKIVLLALLAVTCVLLGLFFFVGFDNEVILPGQEKPLTDPQFLPALLYWMYILVIVPIVLIVIYQTIGFVKKFTTSPKEALKGLVAPIIFIVLVGVSLVQMSVFSSDEQILINGVPFEDAALANLTDIVLYLQYDLFLICAVATIISLLGVLKFVNKVK